MKASLENVLEASRGKELPFPPESAAFVALCAAEKLISRPGRLTPAAVVFTEGEIRVVLPTARSDEAAAADSVRAVLGAMLVPDRPSTFDALVPPRGGDLAGLRRELEASLMPLNRPIARRVLARYLRDALRGVPLSMLVEEETTTHTPSADAMEQILEDLSGAFVLAGTVSSRPPSVEIDLSKDSLPPVRRRQADPRSPPTRAQTKPLPISDASEAPRKSNHLLYATITLLVLGILGALYITRPELLEALAGVGSQGEERAPATAAPPAPRLGTLRVKSDPADAEVLRLVGTAPAVLGDLAPGVEREIVAIAADGRTARTSFTPTAGTQAYVGIELPSRPPTPGEWEASTRPPPSGELRGDGSARVVTTPPGAQVYVVVGRSPLETSVSPEEPVELLVVAAGRVPQRVVVGPADWQETADGIAPHEASVTLEQARMRRRRKKR